MNYLSLCQAVRAQAGISGEGPSSVSNQRGVYADVVRWVDESYAEIQTMYENWNFLHNTYTFTLQGGQSSYDPSQLTGNGGTMGIRTPTKDTFIIDKQSPELNAANKRLKYVPWSLWQIDNTVLDGKIARPEYYTEDPNGVFHFYPYEEEDTNDLTRIDHVIEFQGYSRPHVMKENLDEPIFNEQYHELIKLGALKRYAEYYNSQEIMQNVHMTYQQQIKKMEFSELPRENLTSPAFVSFA